MTMASSWILARGEGPSRCFRVLYRLGGRESRQHYGGSFKTKREAFERCRWIDSELAGRRIPDLGSLETATTAPTFATAAERWLASRLDVAEGTTAQLRTSVSRAVRVLGSCSVDEVSGHDVAAMIADLHGEGLKPSYIRKVAQATAMVFDHVGVKPNPARDKATVRVPREQGVDRVLPSADHVLAVYRQLPSRYRLPLLLLDATGMRLGELERLTWGDVDEQRGRWRVSQVLSTASRVRWVHVAPVLFRAVLDLCARDDRRPERRVFRGFGGDKFRTAITRACTAAGVPRFSPHELRHRRIKLMRVGGYPWATIGQHVGHNNLAVIANTYRHFLTDETEIDYCHVYQGLDVAGVAFDVHQPHRRIWPQVSERAPAEESVSTHVRGEHRDAPPRRRERSSRGAVVS